MIRVAPESARFPNDLVSRINTDGARLRCNRETPCQNCTARHEQTSCKYKDSKNGTRTAQPSGDPMQQRIDRLEGLVKHLIAQRQQAPPNQAVSSQGIREYESSPLTTAAASDASDVACSAGTTIIDGVHSVYKGVDDWYDVLREVNCCSVLHSSIFLFCSPSIL